MRIAMVLTTPVGVSPSADDGGNSEEEEAGWRAGMLQQIQLGSL
jgi:hypothetical protein